MFFETFLTVNLISHQPAPNLINKVNSDRELFQYQLERHDDIKNIHMQAPDVHFTSYGPSNSYGPYSEYGNSDYSSDMIDSSKLTTESIENIIYKFHDFSHDQQSMIMPKIMDNLARYYKFAIPAQPSSNHHMPNALMEMKEKEKEKEKLGKETKEMIELVMKKIQLALTTKALFKIVLFKAIVNMIAFGCLIYSVIGSQSSSENYSSTSTTTTSTFRPIYSTSNEDEH